MPPGYTSLLFAHLYEDASCPLPTRLFAAFRSFLLASFGLGEQAATERGMMGQGRGSATGAGAAAGGSTAGGAAGGAAGAAGGFASGSISTLAVRLISRRPGRGKRKMARQIGNEEELLAALQTLGEAWSREASASTSGAAQPISVSVSLLDFASLTGVASLAPARCTQALQCMISCGGPLPKPKFSLSFSGVQLATQNCCATCLPQPRTALSQTANAKARRETCDCFPFPPLTAVEQQLAVVQETDILVGMHGAALAHALLLPPHAALVELWPQVGAVVLCLGCKAGLYLNDAAIHCLGCRAGLSPACHRCGSLGAWLACPLPAHCTCLSSAQWLAARTQCSFD